MVKTPRQNRRKGGARKRSQRRGKASNGRPSMMAPIAYSAPIVRNSIDSTRVFRGTEFISTVEIATTSTAGQLMMQQDFNPFNWPNTRARLESALWTYYRFRKLKFWFESTAPTVAGGQLAVATDPSVDDDVNFTSALGYILALPGSRTAPCWESFSISFDCRPGYRPYTWFQNGAEQGGIGNVTGSQGRLLVACAQPVFNMTAGTVIKWTIRVEYEIEFARPSLQVASINQTVVTAGATISVAVDGTCPIASFGAGHQAFFNGQPENAVFLWAPPPIDWFNLDSPPPRYCVKFSATLYFWSDYPSSGSGTKGDTAGAGVGLSLKNQSIVTLVGLV